MQAVVFDLPSVVAKAEQSFSAAAGVQRLGDRIRWVAGDFFAESQEAALPAGDLYVLSRILHGECRGIFVLLRLHCCDQGSKQTLVAQDCVVSSHCMW
jgi:hypothetical protein